MAMRRLMIAMLLAGAAAPAIAGPNDDGDGRRGDSRGHRAERSQSNDSSDDSQPARPDHSANVRREAPRHERTDDSSRARIERNVERPNVDGPSVDRRLLAERFRERAVAERPAPDVAETTEVHRSADDGVRQWRSHERRRDDSPSSIEERNLRQAPTGRFGGSGDLVQQKRPLPRVLDRDHARVSRTPIFGTQPPPPATASSVRARSGSRWSAWWRNDDRYDWRDWRRHNRSRFHLGFYYDPFGWDYMRYPIGFRLWPSYYRSTYWLNDPWQYRLPPAYGPYRWIRYHDDALLVNIYTGEVVDVVYDFFW